MIFKQVSRLGGIIERNLKLETGNSINPKNTISGWALFDYWPTALGSNTFYSFYHILEADTIVRILIYNIYT